ncbi:ZIP family metal transporter [Marinobacterium lutimaris]|uniref:Zinc transporter, ZIP family n=1 Tax=Marinobacterium lutimaris TaxID=568106 RepID=A0A1H5XIC3_9GAMM|nr:ZIP family metal transporter [Marinobacterium lutimaris]SEG11479.1 zinc transporter, ZIP family [Marinobacterium lutimaris]
MSSYDPPSQGFINAWLAEIRGRPRTAAALLTAVLAILVLLLSQLLGASVLSVSFGEAAIGGFIGFASTALGACGALLLTNLKARTEDSMLGFAAGMMLAASSFSLILPGLAEGERLTGSPVLSSLILSLGLALGVALMLGLDRFTPHQHEHLGAHGPDYQRLSRVWLFTLAIALHNLPEGMAIGVSFSGGDLSVGLPLTTAIAVQNIPEGLAVAMALRAAGMKASTAVLLAGATGLMELLGSFLGIGVASGVPIAYPVGLGLAAGAMLFVVSHEVIPETHRNGHQTPATIGLMAGFGLMMILDTALG